jgi:integrase
VGIAYLPDAANGKKQGVDDYLAVGEGTVGDLETTAEDRLRETGAPSGHAAVGGGAPSGSSRAPRRALLHPPKGDKTRSVRLTGHAVEALKDHRKRQLKQRLAAGPLWRENDLVFASTVGTPFDVGNFDLPLFQAAPAARRAPQDKVSRLRHTSATILLSKGTHLKIVQKMLEHATQRRRWAHTPTCQRAR